MRAIIFCASIHHGNTLKVAKAIAETLKAEIVNPWEADPAQTKFYDLIGIGSGVYFGRMHRSVLKLVKELPTAEGCRAFIFSTSGLPMIPLVHDYHRSVKDALSKKGYKVIGEFTCRGYTTHGPLRWLGGVNKGRPSERDLENARKFAEKLLSLPR